ncbi:MAG: hypothetical protein QXZ09_09185, partial [Candidatus Methanomethylicaceae archaeon]
MAFVKLRHQVVRIIHRISTFLRYSLPRYSRNPGRYSVKDRSIRFVLYPLLAILMLTLLTAGCASRRPAAEPTATASPALQPTATPVPSPTATPEPPFSVTDTPVVETPASAEGVASEGEIVRLVLVPGQNEARYRVRE